MNETWLKEYFDLYKKPLFDQSVVTQLLELKNSLESVHKNGGKTMAMGNGASASIASHISTDLSKGAGIRTVNFNDANLITALSNDFGLLPSSSISSISNLTPLSETFWKTK